MRAIYTLYSAYICYNAEKKKGNWQLGLPLAPRPSPSPSLSPVASGAQLSAACRQCRARSAQWPARSVLLAASRCCYSKLQCYYRYRLAALYTTLPAACFYLLFTTWLLVPSILSSGQAWLDSREQVVAALFAMQERRILSTVAHPLVQHLLRPLPGLRSIAAPPPSWSSQ
jgi:hypothetical protein